VALTATDYANIQRMIDATIEHTVSNWMDEQERDLREEWQGEISDVQHQLNQLENSIDREA
jgi:hypothetical protein